MKCPRRLAAAVLVAGIASQAWATVWEVPSTDNPDIPTALAKAQPDDTVLVRRGTYATSFTVKDRVIIQGEETSATTLTGTITWSNGGILERFTLAGPGLALNNATSGTLRNNIFRDASGTALRIAGALRSPGTLEISRNTFYRNATPLELVNSDATVSVQFNLFANSTTNGVTLTAPADGGPTLQNNHFFSEVDKPVGNGETHGDPLFLSPSDLSSDLDLHVDVDSPHRDRGAYSGPNADPTPTPVTGVTASLVDLGEGTVGWDGNRAYGVSIKDYLVRFKRTSTETSGTLLETVQAQDPEPDTYSAPIDLTPKAPEDLAVGPMDRGIHVTWTKDPRADGYRVRIATAPGGESLGIDVGNQSSYDAGGLANGTRYHVSVASYANGDRYFSLTARSSSSGEPESRISKDSPKVSLPLVQSPWSAEVSAVAEPLQGYPLLEDKSGCFLSCLGGTRASDVRPSAALALLGLAVCWVLGRPGRRRLLWAGVAVAAWPGIPEAQAGWVAGASAGLFYPAEPDWADHYGERYMPDGKVSLGYLPVPQLEAGVEAGFRTDEGKVRTSSSGEKLSTPVRQTLSVVPAHAYVLLNLRWREDQWLVPYVAGGYSRLYYWSEVRNGTKVRGHQEGYNGRAGLKFLVDRLDAISARNARDRVGIRHTYVLLEAQRSWVKDFGDAETDLGGTAYYGGISVEF